MANTFMHEETQDIASRILPFLCDTLHGIDPGLTTGYASLFFFAKVCCAFHLVSTQRSTFLKQLVLCNEAIPIHLILQQLAQEAQFSHIQEELVDYLEVEVKPLLAKAKSITQPRDSGDLNSFLVVVGKAT